MVQKHRPIFAEKLPQSSRYITPGGVQGRKAMAGRYGMGLTAVCRVLSFKYCVYFYYNLKIARAERTRAIAQRTEEKIEMLYDVLVWMNK